jgi:3-hydroxyacyl-[acyl-carrier-protein] dehydratase
MRWYWIDRFLSFESGRRAVAVKCIAQVEEHMEWYVPGHPLMPGSLILEGFAQTGGLLVGEHGGFTKRVVLAKVSKAIFHFYPRPGDTMRYTCTLTQYDDSGAQVHATSHVGERMNAEAELMFGHVPPQPGIPDEMFEPCDFLTMVRIFGMYDAAVDQQGRPLSPPEHLLEAERVGLAPYS